MHNAITLTLTLFLASQCLAQREPPRRREINVARIMNYLGPQVDHIAESIAKRYKLSETPPLREALQVWLNEGDVESLLSSTRAPKLEPTIL